MWGPWVDLGGGIDAEAATLKRELPLIVLEPRTA